MTDEEKEKVTYTRPKDEGEVDKRRFAGIMGVAGTVAMIALISFFSIGMVGAALGVGIGGFVANFEQVTYNNNTVQAASPGDNADAQIYPVLGAQAACGNAPQLEASLAGQANISGGVEFFKDLPLPSSVGFSTNEFARVSIIGASPSGQNITIKDLDLRLTALETPELALSGAEIKEFGPNSYNNGNDSAFDSYAPSGSGDVTGSGSVANTPEFGIEANSFVLPDGGTAATHQVSFQQISLTNLDLAVNIIDNSTYTASDTGPVPRVVDPTSRDCGSLADESGPDAFNNATDGTGGGNVLAY
jgi:hypothetical protein